MKVGIIGCGGVAPGHIRAYQRNHNVEVVGLCDLNLERARYLANKFRVEDVYEDYWDLFKSKDLDLVDICTPASTHAKIVCNAAEAVPNILVEKPMALTVSECDEMFKKTSKNSVNLCIGHNQIFSPHIQKIKKIIESGDFDLLSLRTSQKESFEILNNYDLAPAWNVLPAQRGIIWEVCCHLAYLQLHFLPDIKEVYAIGERVKYSVYDDFSVLLRTSGQSFGLIELSWISKETEIVYEFRDSEGNRCDIFRDYDYLFERSVEPPVSLSNVLKNVLIDEKRYINKWWSFLMCYIYKGKIQAGYALISKYIEAIKNDLSPPVTPQEGRKTINLLESIEKSLDDKRPVKLE